MTKVLPDKTILNQRKKVGETAPVEMARAMKVTNRTIVNWAVALAKNGLLEPQLGQKRIRSCRVVQWGSA